MHSHIPPEDLSKIIELQQEVVTADLSMGELMELICHRTQNLTRALGAVVEMAENEEMVYTACSGTLEKSLGVRLNINTSLSGMSVRSGEVLYCQDSETDSRVDRVACRKVGAASMICVPLNHRQKIVGVLKVVSDEAYHFSEADISILRITAGLLSASIAQSAANEALKKSELKAREATEAKSEFLANMSHEIRTPLNGIMGMAGLLEDTSLTSQQKEYVTIMKSSADGLLSIVNDILDFSKIEAKKLIIEEIDFELEPTIEDVCHLMMVSAKKKGIEFTYGLSKDLPHFVKGDPGRIRQILMNLLGNAIKFTSHGSVSLNVSANQEFIQFDIIDTGIGISTKLLEQIFRPFSQADASTTRKFGGTGLGLSISKRLTEIMNGEIGATSIEGQGSTFWFKIPLLMSKKDQKKSTAKAVTETIKKMRILVAEDNSVNALIARVMVEKMGHTVTVVGNGKEAIEALRLAPYDLILMDCQMPILDGFEATKKIRHSTESWREIPIIAMTANAMAGDREKCLNAGMTGYISKPMKKEDLLHGFESLIKI